MENLKNPNKYLGNELEYLKKVLQAESWSNTGGSWTQALEQKFAARFGMPYAVAMNSGTATLHCALEACGVQPGDEVISPGLTVIMDTTATLHANAIPVYADIDPRTFNLDPADVERKISPRTKAIIAVSLYGLPPDLDAITELAARRGIAVIEDNAQCVLSTYKGRLAGTVGHVSSYSFENTKHISCGEGGMVLTKDETLARQMRKIGGHGFKNLQATEGRIRLNQEVFQNPNYKRHDEVGWNYRLSEFSAAVALSQLERVDELVDLRIRSAALFIEVMRCCDYLIPQFTPDDRTNSYYTLGVAYHGDESIGVSWQDFRKEYVQQGGDGFYGAWAVPYLEPVMVERKYVRRCPEIYGAVQYGAGLCPQAEQLQRRIMQFKTNYRDLKLAETKAACLLRTIQKFAGN